VPAPRIRPARPADAADLARLTTQLGYPVDPGEQGRRLERVLASGEDDAVLVAVDTADRPLGWVHVAMRRLLELEDTAQVTGLVVDEAARSGGIGAALLAAGEAWAHERGCRTMDIASRESRVDAHRFYERHGYTRYKISHRFRKTLADRAE
jgi:GNAT superfamily N-acetyltransferase